MDIFMQISAYIPTQLLPKTPIAYLPTTEIMEPFKDKNALITTILANRKAN